MPRTRLRALAALLPALALPLLLAARPFHLRLERSDPADGSTVAPPAAIQLWFSQRTELKVTRVVLRTAQGDTIRTGAAERAATAGAPVRVPVLTPLADGRYAADWRTMAADGHVVRGTIAFTVKTPAP